MVKIAVLDSCAWTQHPVFKKCRIYTYVYDGSDWNVADHNKNKEYLFPHGTATCGIIASQIDPNIEIHNFDIYDKNPLYMKKKTISALRHISRVGEYKIINMSLGMRTPDVELEEQCQKIHENGMTIVAAFDNAGAISYPAALPYVVGVDTSFRCTHPDDFVWVENSPITIRAKGGIQRVPWINPEYILNQGSSFAAPYVTAYIANLYADGLDEKIALDIIRKKARYTYTFEKKDDKKKNIEISKVALFPYNKEMNALISFRDKLKFKIVGVYDSKYSGHIGLPIKGLFDNDAIGKVQSISEMKWDEIDTLIFGHVSELEGQSGVMLKERIMKECLDHEVNVFSFDNEAVSEYEDLFEEKNLQITMPEKGKLMDNRFGKMYIHKTPVVSVFGTSKKQGKYTVQLQLRYALQDMGYKVGQLGTEPTAPLFDIDEVYAFGYNGNIDEDGKQMINSINEQMHYIDQKNLDIIITGSQSGTIPAKYYNVGQMPVSQLLFLLGCNPDAVILCVNIDDSEEYIERTIQVIESLGSCKVICIAIYPFSYKNGWGIIRSKKEKVSDEEIKEMQKKLNDRFHIPVVETGDSEAAQVLAQSCIHYFGDTNE